MIIARISRTKVQRVGTAPARAAIITITYADGGIKSEHLNPGDPEDQQAIALYLTETLNNGQHIESFTYEVTQAP